MSRRWQASSVTGQIEDLVESGAVVERGGDDALGPEAAGPQLVHPHAGGHAVVAGAYPIVGRRGDDEAHPARQAGQTAACLPTQRRHPHTQDTPKPLKES